MFLSNSYQYFYIFEDINFQQNISHFIFQFGFLVICPTKNNYYKLTENIHCLFLNFCLLQGEVVVVRHESKFVLKSVHRDILEMQWHVRESKTWISKFNNSLSWNLVLLPTSQFPQIHKVF